MAGLAVEDAHYYTDGLGKVNGSIAGSPFGSRERPRMTRHYHLDLDQ